MITLTIREIAPVLLVSLGLCVYFVPILLMSIHLRSRTRRNSQAADALGNVKPGFGLQSPNGRVNSRYPAAA